KEDHKEYSLQKALLRASESRTPLRTLLELVVQKPVKGSGYNLLLLEENDKEQSSVRYTES
ncbi:MAG: hypothetical protein EXX96DRAFT_460848, partial [Benjaminiella poitrasii]